MFITGPDVIKTVTGEDVTFEELGGAHGPTRPSPGSPTTRPADEAGLHRVREAAAVLPAVEQPRRAPRPPRRPRLRASPPPTRQLDTLIPDSPNQPYDIHRVIETVLDEDTFCEVHAGVRAEHRGRVRPGRRRAGRAWSPTSRMHFAGCLDIDAREGRPVRPDLRRLLHPYPDLRRRPRVPARRHPGMGRDHPPRRQAAVRLRRGHRPQGHRHHPQGLRRRLRRHGLQAPRRRRQPRLADRPDRRHGRPGRRQHPVPPRARRRRRPRGAPQRRRPPSTRTPSPTRTSPPSAATSTPSSAPPRPAPPSPGPSSHCAPNAKPCHPRNTATSHCDANSTSIARAGRMRGRLASAGVGCGTGRQKPRLP